LKNLTGGSRSSEGEKGLGIPFRDFARWAAGSFSDLGRRGSLRPSFIFIFVYFFSFSVFLICFTTFAKKMLQIKPNKFLMPSNIHSSVLNH
jgi:hypothetical protein